jgi:uncharacterized protein
MRFRTVAVLAGVALAVTFVAAGVVTENALRPGRRPLSESDRSTVAASLLAYDALLRDVEISATDGATLRAWDVRPSKFNNNVVILFHGVSDNRLGMLSYAELFLRHGYEVILPDARAHGLSGGDIVSYGLRESSDISRWVDWLHAERQPSCIYGFAESMGAGTLLQSLRYESRFCAVVAESPFSTFREVAYDRFGQFFHGGDWIGRILLRPIVEASFYYAKWKYKLDLRPISPEQAVSVTNVPVFLIHGSVDGNIPVHHSRSIAARNHAVILWEVPKADHCGALNIAPAEFEQRTVDWFDHHDRRASMLADRRKTASEKL